MKLGFIGTGEITKSVVTGIINSKIKFRKINISRRNNIISKKLKRKSKKISIFENNQLLIDNSDWIFLAVTPAVGKKILKKLRFSKKNLIISFISTIKMKELRKLIKINVKIIRAIPLPPIALMKGPIPIYPSNKKVRNFFNKIGNTIEIKNENSSINFWAISSLMAPYYELLYQTSEWLQKKGLNKISSQKYITSLFSALSDNAVVNSNKDLKILVKNSQTPNGLNEQTLKYLKNSKFYKKYNNSLDEIFKKLK